MLGVINSFLVFFDVVDDFTTLPALIVVEVRLCKVFVLVVVVVFMVDSIEFDCLSFFLSCVFFAKMCVLAQISGNQSLSLALIKTDK